MLVSGGLVGRDRELGEIDGLLVRAQGGVAALLIEGEAGIGKTAIVDEGVRRARASGRIVLRCRPAHAEAALSLAAVADLLSGVDRATWDALPPPQRRALDVAVLHEDADQRPVDQRAIAAGVHSLVTALATETPVVLAIDDVQWLDDASASILDFVLRRLESPSVALLVARRVGEPCALDAGTILPHRAVTRRRLEALPVDAMIRLLRARAGPDVSRATLTRVHGAARGNPLFALEIVQALGRAAPHDGDPLPVPGDIRDLVARRADTLPRRTRAALLAAALLAEPTLEAIGAAVGDDVWDSLDPAERDGIATVHAGRVDFAHPLHAAGVVSLATAAERRAMHRRIAETADDPEQRARHLAIAASDRDEASAATIEAGASSAATRGGVHGAAHLLERARALTPSSEVERSRARGLRAAELYLRAGDRGDAIRVLDDLLVEALLPGERAEALRLLGELAFSNHDLMESERVLTMAMDAADHPARIGRIELDLVYLRAAMFDFEGAARIAHGAVEHLRSSDDTHLLGEALSYAVQVDFLCGRGVDWAALEQAMQLEDPDRMPPLGMAPSAIAALLLCYVGRHDEARRQMATVHERLVERGNDVDRSQLLMWWSFLETRAGDLATAARLADDAMAAADLMGNRALYLWASVQRALVNGLRGEIDGARACFAEVTAVEAGAIRQLAYWVAAANAGYELARGNAVAAWEACRQLTEAVERDGIGEPILLIFLPDAIEALVELGELDRASALTAVLEARGAALDRTWALATGARCRALIHAARGESLDAVAAADDALVEHERIDLPFDRARALLVRGAALRRSRQWAMARAALDEAVAEFDRIGTPLWAERATGELARIPGRRPRADGSLTPTEHRVAELAAEGLANKAIARALGITVHTVEVHLSRVYAKVGVRSRAQLARRLPSNP